ncbi:hypothetical protein [Paenibacillus naphthalenovorans]|uniref:hypothetical protein n=1 Tax=Paenibacillus naphthalenovorans TaxID=162209 RepID=UPI0015872366|nr:hypothetical protein [Paenibacillus naphthalenovorans]
MMRTSTTKGSSETAFPGILDLRRNRVGDMYPGAIVLIRNANVLFGHSVGGSSVIQQITGTSLKGFIFP